LVNIIFKAKSLIDRLNFNSNEECINEILRINANPHQYAKIISELVFVKPLTNYLDENFLWNF
tara:strand:+ start:26413 stop:26601 length:189 start_codon:yes stop_codon:yes gene_type:complete